MQLIKLEGIYKEINTFMSTLTIFGILSAALQIFAIQLYPSYSELDIRITELINQVVQVKSILSKFPKILNYRNPTEREREREREPTNPR